MNDMDLLDGVPQFILTGVREYAEEYPVEIRRDVKTDRLMIVAWNEGHNNCTKIDLFDLLDWFHPSPNAFPRTSVWRHCPSNEEHGANPLPRRR